MTFNSESEKPFSNQNYITISHILKKLDGSDNLIIDGILATVGDYKKIATEWLGNTITLVEMELSENQAKQLVHWSGEYINLHLCGHDNYDLSKFLNGIKNWNGKQITIGFSGEKLFRPELVSSIKNVKYRKLRFYKCNIPKGIIDIIINAEPNLEIILSNPKDKKV